MSVRFTIGPVRARYLKVFEKEINKFSGKEQYSCQIFIDKEDKINVKKVKKAIKEAAREKWGKDVPANVITFLRDGDIKDGTEKGVPKSAEAGQEPYGNHYFIGAISDTDKPEVVGRDPNVKLTKDDIADGDWFYISLVAIGSDKQADRVIVRLGNMQFIKPGEPMGSKVRAESEFDRIDEDDIDDFDEDEIDEFD